MIWAAPAHVAVIMTTDDETEAYSALVECRRTRHTEDFDMRYVQHANPLIRTVNRYAVVKL